MFINMPIDNLVTRVVPITSFKKGEPISLATGFFYRHEDKLYLITNRHNVVNEEKEYFPDELKLRLHVNKNDISQNELFPLPLYGREGKPVWFEHPTSGNEIDVIALLLDMKLIESSYFISTFNKTDQIPEQVEIPIGEDVLVLGYPLGYYDTLHNLPLVRDAILASVYPVPFKGKPYVLIDSRLHRGTSGSPVITKLKQMHHHKTGITMMATKPVSFLVGVQSANLDVSSRDPEKDEPLGLSIVWLASLITEILNNAKQS